MFNVMEEKENCLDHFPGPDNYIKKISWEFFWFYPLFFKLCVSSSAIYNKAFFFLSHFFY